jgi:subtilisin-like proprotein convertase family protein
MSIHTNTASLPFTDQLTAAYNIYQPILVTNRIFSISGGSDHQSFWNRGYKAILAIESTSDFNPYYHTVNDNFSHVNVPYFVAQTRAAIAALLSFAWDYKINIQHTPLQSGPDTNARIATAIISSPQILARVTNGPRLYYKVGTGSFTYVNAYYRNLDTFKFSIPGRPLGTTISYYIAAQDSLGKFVGTLPVGGKGINPPGTIPPSTFFVYQVANIYNLNQCSNTLPKPILDMQTTYDTINITTTGAVLDLNVNLTIYHTWDGDISIYLRKMGGSEIDLSSGNGGSGDNYINTTFDDEATQSITQGSAPFTGSFRPEQPLSTFDNGALNGNWILRIYDGYSGDTGQLISWCVIAQYSTLIGIGANNQPLQYALSQNYPNPFNASTKIDFTLPKQTNVRLIIYDVLGREVKQLLSDNIKAGEYSVYFNAAELSSGIYFYSMYFDGNLFDTKRMVLLR